MNNTSSDQYINFLSNYFKKNQEDIFLQTQGIDGKKVYKLVIKPNRPSLTYTPITRMEVEEVLIMIKNNLHERSFNKDKVVRLDKNGNTNSNNALMNNFFKFNPTPENFIGAFHSIFSLLTDEFLLQVDTTHQEHAIQFLTSSITVSSHTPRFLRVLSILRNANVGLSEYKDLLPTYFTHHKEYFLNDGARYQNSLFEFVVNRLSVSDRVNYEHLLPNKSELIKTDTNIEMFKDIEKSTGYITLDIDAIPKKFSGLVLNDASKIAVNKVAHALQNNKSLLHLDKVKILPEDSEILIVLKSERCEPINLEFIRNLLEKTLYEYNNSRLRTKNIEQQDVDKMLYVSYMDTIVKKSENNTNKVNKI